MDNKHYQVKIINIVDECVDYFKDGPIDVEDEYIFELLKLKKPNNGDLIMLDDYRHLETYIYIDGELIESRDDYYTTIPYEISMLVPGSAYDQYQHPDVYWGDCIVSLTLTHKDSLWNILNLNKYSKLNLEFEVYGVQYNDNKTFRINKLNTKPNFIDIEIPHNNNDPDWDKLRVLIAAKVVDI